MDITRDVMSMVQQGKSVAEMRDVIVQRYGSFGPSTDPKPGARIGPASPAGRS